MSTINDSVVDDDDEYVWTTAPFKKSNPLHQGLHDLESALRCGICCAWYTAPVSIAGCHHTFCSECIRNRIRTGILNMKRTAACPVCREPIACRGGDYQLLPNRSMEELVTKFTDIKQSLRTALANGLTTVPQSKVAASGVVVAAAGEASAENLSQATASTQEQEGGRSPAGLLRRSPRAASRQGSVNYEEKENSDPAHDNNENDDDCVIVVEEEKKAPRLKKMGKTIYHGLKKKQLQDKCRQCGLSTRGDEKQLRERHQEYVTLYNSECDSFQPRSKEDLLRLMQEREKARKVRF
jgi:E3 ubiquitin-protein ligase RAD18